MWRAEPDVSGLIGPSRPDQGELSIVGRALIIDEVVAVKAGNAVLGAGPEKSIVILGYAEYGDLWQSLLGAPVTQHIVVESNFWAECQGRPNP